jgi:hypothetical protein
MPSSKSASAWPLTIAARWKIAAVLSSIRRSSTLRSAMSPTSTRTRSSFGPCAATTSSNTSSVIG